MNTHILQYFKSPAAMAEFALLHTDGETRQRMLGVTRAHYSDEKLALEWAAQFILLLDEMSVEACHEVDKMHAELLAH